MTERHVNCISYVLFRQGLIDNERYIPPPSLNDLLSTHDRVFEVAQAQVVAVTRERTEYEFHLGPTVCHLGLLEEEGTYVLHRRKYGDDVKRDSYKKALGEYLNQPDKFKILYLKRKTYDNFYSFQDIF